MPPKKKAKKSAKAGITVNEAPAAAADSATRKARVPPKLPTTMRATRSSTIATPNTPSSSNNDNNSVTSTKNGKRKRLIADPNTVADTSPDSSDSDAEAITTGKHMKGGTKTKSTATTTPLKAKTSGRKTKMAARGTVTERWFDAYELPETESLNIANWMEDLGIHAEGAFFYYILWKCNPVQQMIITKQEFVKCMQELGVKSNEQLLARLPALMEEVRPRVRPTPNPIFKVMFKWCFAYFRQEGAKNLAVEYATELFKSLLNADRYEPSWKPEDSPQSTEDSPAGCTPGEFPHLNAFLEFINSDPKPVAVITKDQFEQFYEFNADVPWDLKDYFEESAWPALIDSYVTWKMKKYPANTPMETGLDA